MSCFCRPSAVWGIPGVSVPELTRRFPACYMEGKDSKVLAPLATPTFTTTEWDPALRPGLAQEGCQGGGLSKGATDFSDKGVSAPVPSFFKFSLK